MPCAARPEERSRKGRLGRTGGVAALGERHCVELVAGGSFVTLMALALSPLLLPYGHAMQAGVCGPSPIRYAEPTGCQPSQPQQD
jgi:hypothetical protein